MDLSKQLEFVWSVRGPLLEGLAISVCIAFFALIMGFIIGVILAMIKIMPQKSIISKILNKFADVYITVIRGTPLLVQLLIMYNVVLVSFKYMQFSLPIPIITFGINSGAYMAEIIRSGINSIDKGQLEAGRSLGLSWGKSMFKIVIPQAIKVVIPTIFNEIIILVKETSVVCYIAIHIGVNQVWDLLGVAENIGTYNAWAYMALIFTVAIMYLILVLLLTFIQKLIERRLSKNER